MESIIGGVAALFNAGTPSPKEGLNSPMGGEGGDKALSHIYSTSAASPQPQALNGPSA